MIRRPLLIVVLAAITVRVVALAASWGMEARIGDEQHYLQIATNLVQGNGFSQWGHPTSMRPPLYPFAIAATWLVTGVGAIDAIRVLQLVLGLGTVLAVYALGRMLYGERAALFAAAGVAIYPSLVIAGALILTETLFTLLLVMTVLAYAWLVRQRTLGAAALLGLCLGLGALTRSVLWPSIVFVAGMVLAVEAPWRRRAGLMVTCVLAYTAIVGPWAARNTRLQQRFTVVDTMGGLNLMMGNYEHTPEDRMWAAVELTGGRAWSRQLPLHDADGSDWTEGKKDRWAQRQAVEYMKANPGTTLRRAAIKFADFWGLEREFIAGMERGLFPVPMPWAFVLAVAITASWVTIAVLAVVGVLVAAPADWRTHLFMIGIAGFICFVHTVVFAHSRYHLPLVPLLALYAGRVVADVRWPAVREARGGSLAAAVCLVGLAGIWVRELVVRDGDRVAQFIRTVL